MAAYKRRTPAMALPSLCTVQQAACTSHAAAPAGTQRSQCGQRRAVFPSLRGRSASGAGRGRRLVLRAEQRHSNPPTGNSDGNGDVRTHVRRMPTISPAAHLSYRCARVQRSCMTPSICYASTACMCGRLITRMYARGRTCTVGATSMQCCHTKQLPLPHAATFVMRRVLPRAQEESPSDVTFSFAGYASRRRPGVLEPPTLWHKLSPMPNPWSDGQEYVDDNDVVTLQVVQPGTTSWSDAPGELKGRTMPRVPCNGAAGLCCSVCWG